MSFLNFFKSLFFIKILVKKNIDIINNIKALQYIALFNITTFLSFYITFK